MNEIVGKGQSGRRGAQPGPLHRVSVGDAVAAREVLKQAVHLIEPANRTQRQLIRELMPELYVMRNDGFSFEQIAQLLGEVNVKLQPGTIRSYYSEMLADRLAACEARFNEQLLILAEIKKETQGHDVATIATKASAMMSQRIGQQSERINTVLGVSTPPPPRSAAPASAESATREAVKPPRAERPAESQEEHNGVVSEDSFGLLNGAKKQTGGPLHSFLDDEPSIPSLKIQSPVRTENVDNNTQAIEKKLEAASPPSASTLKCLPLTDGIKPLVQKKEVPDFVYQEGNLEHPAIPGLMLTLAERLYGSFLEIVDTDTAETRFEELKEKSLRVLWRKKGTKSVGTTAGDFTPMNTKIFAEHHR